MAIMIPRTIQPDYKSQAEIRVFNQLRDNLDDSFTVLHAFSLSRHHRKPRGEADFVILSPLGILILEVKGGTIGTEFGEWYSKSQEGHKHELKENPFDQASGNMFALKKHLTEVLPREFSSKVFFGFAVIFPDCITLNRASPEIDTSRLINYDTFEADPVATINYYYNYNRQEVFKKSYKDDKDFPPLTKNEIKTLQERMRPDFEVVSCLGSRVNHTKERFLTLTEEQYNHLDMIANNPNLKVRLRGGAGTGKTLLAVEQARRCALQGKKVLFLCFNKNLAFFIQHGFEEEGLTENISVWSFHSYAWNTIKQSQLDETQINWRDNDSLLNEMPALFEEAFCQVHEKPPCDVLIIDEGQDLDVTPWVNSLDWLVRKGLKGGTWYWFEDSAQDLFGHSKSAIDDFSPFNLELTKNCRNTKQIGEYTTRLTGCGEMKYLVDNGDEVKVIYYNSLQHQQQLLEKEITKTLSGKVKPEDIVILSHRARGNPKSAIKGIDTLGGKKVVDWQSENPDKNIRFATVQSFKGLESPVIFRIDVEELEKKDKKILNYVSFSRATTLLVVFMSNKLKDKLEVAEAEE